VSWVLKEEISHGMQHELKGGGKIIMNNYKKKKNRILLNKSKKRIIDYIRTDDQTGKQSI
jgi:hypothetical protein